MAEKALGKSPTKDHNIEKRGTGILGRDHDDATPGTVGAEGNLEGRETEKNKNSEGDQKEHINKNNVETATTIGSRDGALPDTRTDRGTASSGENSKRSIHDERTGGPVQTETQASLEEVYKGAPQRPTQEGSSGDFVAQTASAILEESPQENNDSSIKEEERPILSEFSSPSVERRTSQKLTLERNNHTLNNDLLDSLSPPYGILESSEHTSPASSVVTDSSPNEPQDNEDIFTASQLIGGQQRAGAMAVLSNVEATGTSGRRLSKEDQTAGGQGSFAHGTVTREGDMVSFVADDLMTKIRQSASSASTSPANSNRDISPTTASISSSSSRFSMRSSSIGSSSAIPPIDPTAVADLEKQCKRVADSLDLMFGHLAGTLHNMSAITVGHTQTYRDAVEKAGVTADQCVRSMYALMAKCEELQNSMQATKDLSVQIKSIKKQLDELEAICK